MAKQFTETYRWQNNTPIYSGSRTVNLDTETKPPKRVGQFITLPDGSKFRRATNYSRSSAWREPGARQTASGKGWDSARKKWYNTLAETGDGGYYASYIMDSQLYSAFKVDEAGKNLSGVRGVPFIPTSSSNEAVTKALLDIADGKANLGENLGTLGQTMRLVCNPVKALAGGLQSVYANKSLRPFLRESFRSLHRKGPLTAAAEQYLAYVYGWKPLMQDIYGLMELAKERGERPLFLSGSGKAKREVPVPGGSFMDFSHQTRQTVTGGSANSQVRCKLWARIDPNTSGVRVLNQLGLANPAALAWELATFSFVVDWVLPIGPVLNAWSAPAGLIFVNGSKSNRLSITAQYESKITRAESVTHGPSAGGQVRYEGYVREEITSWPKPGFWFDPNPLRGDRLLKATALLVANLGPLR